MTYHWNCTLCPIQGANDTFDQANNAMVEHYNHAHNPNPPTDRYGPRKDPA